MSYCCSIGSQNCTNGLQDCDGQSVGIGYLCVTLRRIWGSSDFKVSPVSSFFPGV